MYYFQQFKFILYQNVLNLNNISDYVIEMNINNYYNI